MVADFNPGALEKRIQQVRPESDELGYKVMKTYMSHMDSREKDGRPNFDHNSKDAKKLAGDIMGSIQEHILKNYLMAKGADYDAKHFNKEGVDLLVRNITGLSESSLVDEFVELGTLKGEHMVNLGRGIEDGLTKYHSGVVKDSITNNLEAAQVHVSKGLAKHGYGITKPNLLTPSKTVQHFYALAGAKKEGFIQPEYIKKHKDHLGVLKKK